MKQEFLIAGYGGHGVMFAGQLLAYAAMDEHREVTWIPSYGPEMRGGTAHCYVTISDRPIGSPIVKRPGIVIVFNKPSFDKYELVVAPGGVLACNCSLTSQRSGRTDITTLYVPATDLADQLGDMRLANMIMLSAVLTVRPIVRVSSLKSALEGYIPSHHRDMLPLNFEALNCGTTFATRSMAELRAS